MGPTEFKLLHFFMTHPERVYSREQLLNHVWGTNVYVEDRTVDRTVAYVKHWSQAGMTAWCRPCAVQDIVFQPAFNALLIGRRAGLMIF